MKKIPLLFIFLSFLACQSKNPESADVIYTNGRIWTGDSANTWAEALAIKGEDIIAVGSQKEVDILRGGKTTVVDLKKQLVVPGLIDNHTHFLMGGFQLASVDLRNAQTPDIFKQLIADFVKNKPQGQWVTGGDWDHQLWGGDLPRKEWIDAVTRDYPVFVNRLDGHMALANSKALALAGITKNTKDIPGGEIVKHPQTGEPTGVLKDEAMSLVTKVIPEAPLNERLEALQRAMNHAVSLGLTQVHDVSSLGGWSDLETYRKAHEQGTLKIRIYSFIPISSWKKLADYVAQNGKGDDWLRWGSLKGFVDGSLGSHTAWFHRPFVDAPKSKGFMVTDSTDLKKWVLSADSAKLHVTVHAIGDHANDWILDVFEQAEKQNGQRDRRFRVEHAQHLSPHAIQRFAQLNVIPSMQPYHAIDDGRWAAKYIDNQALMGTYAFKSLLDAKAKLTFGSDWTVAPLSPLEGICAAVTRQTIDGKNPNGWFPEQKISVEDALKCYTQNNAYAGFQENKTGTLAKDKLADFVVLSDNIFTIQAEKIKEVKVMHTIIGGKEVYKR